jgi:hypothetical protein
METTDKAPIPAYESIDRIASSANQAAEEAPGEKGGPLKKAEEQLMNNFRNYVRYNPWVTQ